MAEYIDKEALFAKFDRLGLGEHSIMCGRKLRRDK